MRKYQYIQQRGSLQEAVAPQQESHDLHGIAANVIAAVPAKFARTHRIVPVAADRESLTIATDRPHDIGLKDKLTFLLNRRIVLVYASHENLLNAIEQYYGIDLDIDRMIGSENAAELLAYEHAAPRKPMASRGGWAGSLGKSISEFKKGAVGLEEGFSDVVGSIPPSTPGEDSSQPLGDSGMFYYVVEEGHRVLVREADGTLRVVIGPNRIFSWGRSITPMRHYIAHPGEFLIVRFRDGKQQHLIGPTEVWFDPRVHQEIKSEDALQLSAKEAVVAYSKQPGSEQITRRIVYGPAEFVPQPGEWLHTFSWHASHGGHQGAVKIPNGLVFQKLWLMPDQMYHDVTDVRTADDAVLTIRLMIFFELIAIERMLETTHDPIGDFVNAATSDVVAFVGKYDLETFKRNVTQLNELATYTQLSGRAEQCGYRINKVVYRGYGAPDALQKMQDEAIEARTKLQLQRATEQQAQDLENYKLDCQIGRAVKRREEQAGEIDHELAMQRQRQQAEMEQAEANQISARAQARQEAEQELTLRERQDAQVRAHLSALRELGVDLTAYLTQARADRVIEIRGSGRGTHLHLNSEANGTDEGRLR